MRRFFSSMASMSKVVTSLSSGPGLVGFAAGIGFLLEANPVQAVFTPYANTPAAFMTHGNGLIWDSQLRTALVPLKKGTLISVMDFCHSGGVADAIGGVYPNSYAVAAAAWSENSIGDCASSPQSFGQAFMQATVSNSLSQSFQLAREIPIATYGGKKIKLLQTPKEFRGNTTRDFLDYLHGDRALVFSASDSTTLSTALTFWTDVVTARNSLKSQPLSPWLDSDTTGGPPITLLFGDGTDPNGNSYPWLEGQATKELFFSSLTDSINAVNMESDSNTLFMYINNHGASTDVLLSRLDGNNYQYRAITSLGPDPQNNTPDNITKGISQISIPAYDLNIANYTPGVKPNNWEIVMDADRGQLLFRALDPTDRTQWLTPGQPYDFSFTHNSAPKPTSWTTSFFDPQSDPNICPQYYCANDSGWPNGSPWGQGYFVFEQDLNANDPAQWPGWANGGDGWVLTPTVTMDFGDAPDSYLTTLSRNGPRYAEGDLQRLGLQWDAEPDGQPTVKADGDDINLLGVGSSDDEDGVIFGDTWVDVIFSIKRPYSSDYQLRAWWDFNKNGVFDHTAELTIDDILNLTPGNHVKRYPLGFDPKMFYSRFRLTWDPLDRDVNPSGEYFSRLDCQSNNALNGNCVSHGEVEDYPVPAPLPVFGALAALGSVRKLRNYSALLKRSPLPIH